MMAAKQQIERIFSRIRERLLFTLRYTVKDGVRELIAALRSHMFHDVETPRSFYGNYEITYTA